MRYIRRTLITALIGTSLCTGALAQTRYISDTLGVPLRTGPSTQYRIIDLNLRSGTPLTVLDADAGEGFSKIRLRDGREGFVRSQYLQGQPGAQEQLTGLQQRHEQLQQQSKTQAEELAALKQALSESRRGENDLNKQASRLQQELSHIKEVASDSLALADRNERLVKEVLQLKQERETLQLEKQRLESNASQRWYLYGAGTVLSGVLLGLILPLLKRRPRRQSQWV